MLIDCVYVEILVYDCLEHRYGFPTAFLSRLCVNTPNTLLELLWLCRDICMWDYSYIVTLRCCDLEPVGVNKWTGLEISMTQGAFGYPYVSMHRVIINGCWANAFGIY